MSKSMDDFGDRMKGYESRETARFMPLLPIYARLDGRGFSKFTKGMDRPYDVRMQRCMIETTRFLVEKSHALVGYTQSDEISLLWYSDHTNSQVFFDGKKQKIVSVLASMATVKFITELQKTMPQRVDRMPTFDCRAFTLPNKIEAANAFLWREQDATKNAVSMAARTLFSHRELMNQGRVDMNEMMWQKGVNFNDYPAAFKRGVFLQHRSFEVELSSEDLARIPERHRPDGPVTRSKVVELEMPKFGSVKNRVEVLFDGADPELNS